MTPTFESRVLGCLVGVTLEALGVPHETITREEIMLLTNGLGLTGLQAPLKPVTFKSLAGLPLGATSDDWQLTLAVAESLLAKKDFDLLDLAWRHVVELNIRTPGWGNTTKRAVREMEKWFQSAGTKGRHPAKPRPWPNNEGGGGNGVAMKIAPLAIFLSRDQQAEQKLIDWCRALGEMTHPDPRAWISAFALAHVIFQCLRNDRPTPQAIMKKTLAAVREIEKTFEPWPVELFSKRLERVMRPETIANADTLRTTTGVSCFAMESVPFVLGGFLRRPEDIRAGVLEVLNAGGDTDTNVNMYAALAGAFAGYEAIPAEWVKAIPDAKKAQDIAKQFLRHS